LIFRVTRPATVSAAASANCGALAGENERYFATVVRATRAPPNRFVGNGLLL
jgi:hypothetical protein